jgi:hypothetical protein
VWRSEASFLANLWHGRSATGAAPASGVTR